MKRMSAILKDLLLSIALSAGSAMLINILLHILIKPALQFVHRENLIMCILVPLFIYIFSGLKMNRTRLITISTLFPVLYFIIEILI
jgi:hypothetical protein